MIPLEKLTMETLSFFSLMNSEDKEVALLCLLICDDGKKREKRKINYWVRNILRK